ncbi:MAG: glycosyltransferase [Actinomycetota bacterium]
MAPESSPPVHSTAGNGATEGAPKATSAVAALAIYDLSWLSADVLLAVVGARREGDDLELIASIGGEVVELQARWLCYRSTDQKDAVDAVVVASLREVPQDRHLEITVNSGREQVSVGPAPAAALGVDLRTSIRENLAALDTESRAQIMDFLVKATAELGSDMDRRRLSRSLFTLRGALREPSPRTLVLRDELQGLNVEAIIRLDRTSFFVRGWMRDEQAEIVRLTAVSPEGERVSLLDELFTLRRPDVDQLYGTAAERDERCGFLAFFTLDAPSELQTGWILEMENAAGVATEVDAPEVMLDPLAARATIVSELAGQRGPDSPLMDHVVPAVTRLQDRLAGAVEVERVEQFGDAPVAPTVSIVVPLYQRIDLLGHQLASFADDRDLREADLIYVLDSPELSEKLFTLAADLHEIYRVPFRIIEASRNGGFSVANNLGASLASGRMLLLLNSDVLPTEAGWLRRLVDFHDSNPKIGAVGPKLLFDDDTLQHAGLYWRRPARYAAWENTHYFKGLHRDLPAANVVRPVPAATAACLLISTDLYRELGGLRSIYIQGDYEDSDLCLRLREAGYETWYLPDVELYHLEGRSYDTSVRQTNARYNSWLHTRLWGKQIGELMPREAFVIEPGAIPSP